MLSLIQVVLSRQRDLSELTYDDIRSNIESNVRYLTKDEHIQLRSNDTTLGNYDTVPTDCWRRTRYCCYDQDRQFGESNNTLGDKKKSRVLASNTTSKLRYEPYRRQRKVKCFGHKWHYMKNTLTGLNNTKPNFPTRIISLFSLWISHTITSPRNAILYCNRYQTKLDAKKNLTLSRLY